MPQNKFLYCNISATKSQKTFNRMVHYLSARKLVFLSPNIILDKSEMIFS